MISGLKSGTGVWGLLTSNNAGAKLFAENDFGNGVAGLSTSWRWYVMTKASGSVLPRIHVWDLSGAWTHTDDSSNTGDGTGPIDTLILGNKSGAGWRGSIAVAVACDTQMNDAAVEAAFTLSAIDQLNAVNAATKRWMVRLNQSSTATNVTDDTSGSGDQSALSGTSVDADNPPGYSYSLSATVAPTGIAVPVGVGTPSVAWSTTASPTGIAVPVTLGTPAVAWSTTAAPGGIAVPVTLGQPTVAMLVGSVAPTGIAVPVAVGTPAVAFTASTASGGSWWQLDSVAKQNRENARLERLAGPLSCPNDGEPLLVDPRSGRRRCSYDGWISPV